MAADEHQQPQTLTRALAELVADGLITRSPDTSDRRQTVLALTDDGATAYRHDMHGRDEWLAAAMADLTDTERGVIMLAAPILDRLPAAGR